MALRPIYVPKLTAVGVEEKDIDFQWYPGMAVSQKQKSIASLHNAAEASGFSPLLEISSKSPTELGVKLSAFNLMITTKVHKKTFSVESAFQSGKVFERGGPFVDLLSKSSREAKKDIRLKESGRLVSFSFFGSKFPLKPRTTFYDWIYINALRQNENLAEEVLQFSGFTDIEFNPKKSINSQAHAAALYVSLYRNGSLDDAIKSPDSFLAVMKTVYPPTDDSRLIQDTLI